MPYIVFIAFFCLGIGLRQGALMDPDTGWHIAAGDYIRAHGLPASDPWSYTAGDAPWYNISWAFDVLLSLVHDLGGLGAVAVVTVLIYALAMGLVCWTAQKSAGSVIAALGVSVVAGFVLLPGMLARPQLFTFLLVVGFYGVLRFGGQRLLLILPLLIAIWANVHGGFIAGFVMLGLFFLEAVSRGERRRAMDLVLIGGVCLLALMANPYGWRIAEAASLTMNSALKDVLMEWRAADLSAGTPIWFLVILFAGLSALFEKTIPLADKLLACFWLAAGLMSERMMQIAALMSAPYLAQALALRLRQLPIGAVIASRDRDYGADLSKPAVRAVLASLSILVAGAPFLSPVKRMLAGAGETFVALPATSAPAAALAFANERYPAARLFAQYGFGGYILYCCRDQRAVFVDGRADTAYPREVLRDAIVLGMMDGQRADPERREEWLTLTDVYGIDGFLASTRSALGAHMKDAAGWVQVYEDEDAALYIRKGMMPADE